MARRRPAAPEGRDGRRPALPEGPFLVLGLARSGEAAALALAARGASVIGADAGSAEKPALAQAAERLTAAGVEVRLDASDERLLTGCGALIKSPGVPQSAPLVQAARRAGVPVLGELELAWRLLPNDFVVVTGTNGKTTTTEWVGHIHRVAGAPAAVAGNVGTALSTLIGELPRDVTVICEASSFQLEDTVEFAPEAAALLNITPDHLDRHGSLEAYAAAKKQAFIRQTPADYAVISDELGSDVPGEGVRVTFGLKPSSQLTVRGDKLIWRHRPRTPKEELDPLKTNVLVPLEEISLSGAHNLQNAMAAAALCLSRGLAPDAVAEGLRTFAGVAHRLELIGESHGVRFVNDSKATNVASTLVALSAFPGGIHLIAGGQGKRQDFSPLAPLVAERCAAVYLIGEDGEQIGAALHGTGVPLIEAGDLETALAVSGRRATDGDVILLSPGCASFDQFRDFEARGDAFRDLVLERIGERG